MEAGLEELKLLQTAIILITTNSVVQHDSLAKVRMLKLSYSSDHLKLCGTAWLIGQGKWIISQFNK